MVKTIKDYKGAIIITEQMIKSDIPPNAQMIVYALLWNLSEGGKYDVEILCREINEFFGWDKSTACHNLKRLEQLGVIERYKKTITVKRLGKQ